jgi:hypothetical protein
MKTERLLTAVVVLQMLILLTQWLGTPVSPAQAQIPDQGAQLNEIITQIQGSNVRLDKLIGILESGKLQVVSVKSDDTQQK